MCDVQSVGTTTAGFSFQTGDMFVLLITLTPSVECRIIDLICQSNFRLSLAQGHGSDSSHTNVVGRIFRWLHNKFYRHAYDAPLGNIADFMKLSIVINY